MSDRISLSRSLQSSLVNSPHGTLMRVAKPVRMKIASIDNLPWVAVNKEYVVEGQNGKQTLAELFDGRSQLIIYHFMFDISWDEGCPHCSFWADNFNGIIVHLNQRDVTMIAVSRAPYSKLAAYQKRMGWDFK